MRIFFNAIRFDVDVKLHLASTGYGDFLANEQPPLRTTVILDKMTEKLVDELAYMRVQAPEPLKQFFEYIRYGYMIDNIVLIITGTLHERSVEDLLSKCHPLGMFDSVAMAGLTIAKSVSEIYRFVLVDTPLAPYFQDWGGVSEADLDELDIEIIRNTLYRAYLEDFNRFCYKLGGSTWEQMQPILEFEADRRTINITLNSIGTELSKDDRLRLFPRFGKLYPEGQAMLARADSQAQVRTVADVHMQYRRIFANAANDARKTLEDSFFEHEVYLNKDSFNSQFGFAVFYSYVKLKEQEIRNIIWIAECVSQHQKQQANHFIPLFER